MSSVIQNLTEEDMSERFPKGDHRNEYSKTETEKKEDLVLDNLVRHVRKQFEINKQDRVQVDLIMLSCLEAMSNTYDVKTQQEIKSIGGSNLFVPLTSQQVAGGTAWINSILSNGWDISPSPIPELKPELKQQIAKNILTVLNNPNVQKTPDGIPLNHQGQPMSVEDTDAIKDSETKKLLEKIKSVAVKRAKKMKLLISDQLVDSNWDNELKDFVYDFCVFPTAFIKTVYKKRKKYKVTSNNNKSLSAVVSSDLVAVDERVSPFNMFPSPDQTTMNDGSLIERLYLTKKSIHESLGVEGYIDTNIREVLKDYKNTNLDEWNTYVDSQKELIEKHGNTNKTDRTSTLAALRFSGPVEVLELRDWVKDLPEDIKSKNWDWLQNKDEDGCVEMEIILVGNKVIKAVPNLDPMGNRGYYCSSYRKTPGSIWGESVATLIKPHQRLVNAVARALSNNMGIASGPMSYILIDRLPQGETLGEYRPWKQYQMTSDPTGANIPPISFFQPNDNSVNLIQVYQYYMNEAYTISGIPRGAMDGATSRIGSGDHTASGIASEIENASKAIRLAVSNIEKDVVVPRLKNQYYTNMMFSEDEEVKGDFQVVAQGASSAIAKAVDNQQAIELLNSVAAGPGAELIGMEGVAAILSRIAKNNDMPNLIPDEEEIKQLQEQKQKNAQQQQQMTPETVKLEVEKMRSQSRIQDQQLEDKNAEAERKVRLEIANLELQMKQMELQAKKEIAQASEDQQLRVTALQGINKNNNTS